MVLEVGEVVEAATPAETPISLQLKCTTTPITAYNSSACKDTCNSSVVCKCASREASTDIEWSYVHDTMPKQAYSSLYASYG